MEIRIGTAKRKMYLVENLLIFLLLMNCTASAQTLLSPDKKIKVSVNISDSVTYRVFYENKEIVRPSIIDMVLNNNMRLSNTKGVKRVSTRSNSSVITSPVPEKRINIPDIYNEIKIEFKSPFSLTFRAYNDGVAYRIGSNIKDSVIVKNEIAQFSFPAANLLYSEVQGGRTDRFHTSFEETYTTKPLDSLSAKTLIFNPVVCFHL